MIRNSVLSATAATALLAFSGVALAQTQVMATSDLNIRSGPGPQYEVIGVIENQGSATLNGCLENSKWCTVSHNGVEGWAYSDYLVADASGQRVIIAERPEAVAVPTVTYEEPSGAGVVTGATTGAVAGALIAGPLGAAVGGVAGAATGGALEASAVDTEVQYVTANPVDPVYLEGEVVVGAGVPETVVVNEIPESEYRYVYINGQAVLVEPETRRIVYVVRD